MHQSRSRVGRGLMRLVFLLILFDAGSAAAVDGQLEAGLGGTVALTDNFDLRPDEEAEGSIVTTLTPFVRLRRSAARLDVNLDAGLNLQHDSGRDEFRADPRVAGFGRAELSEELLFLEVQGIWTRRLASAEGRFSATPQAADSDFINTAAIVVSPYLVHRFGNWATSELRYRRSQIFTDSVETGESSTDQQSLAVSSGPRFTQARLGVRLDRETIRSSTETGDLDRTRGQVDGEWAATRRLSLTGSAGYEVIDTADLRDDPSGPFGLFGARWRPGPRTVVEGRAGWRFGGLSFDGSLSYRLTPGLTFRAATSEDIENEQQTLATDQINVILGPTGEFVDSFTGLPLDLDDPGLGVRNAVVRVRTYQASLVGIRGRNTVTIGLAYDQRSGNFAANQSVVDTFGSWQRQLSPRLSALGRVSYRSISEDEGSDIATVIGQLSLKYSLFENVDLAISYTRTQRFADEPADEYTENAMLFGTRFRF